LAWCGRLAACHPDEGARGSYDLGSSCRLQDHQKAAGIVFQDTASVLFDVEGLQVTDAESGAGGTLEVRAVTDHAAARACPDCGTVSGRVHEQVLTRPRDVARGLDAVQVRWVKRRRECETAQCGRKTFTEWVPRCRRGAG
jgi:hypothetical protein